METKIKVFICLGYFTFLYILAFFANLKYRDSDDILFIGKVQWKAIFVMWLPSLVIFVK